MPGKGNQGWSTKPKDGSPAGRPVTTGTRPQHQVRAWEDEWQLIREFVTYVRRDAVAAEDALLALKKRFEKMDAHQS